ncbi:molybdopterin-containing oxidoreductase family protein [Zavarzinella formosa]|uniref:molybdopterin-containing oxidoreductase family protein n=1 Tax=Zavarzinella formosa TaxID=360055 RepID=UPI00030E1954|nr:molybdopterin oxidoreductase family protein [Zavarzinella formosa]
MKTELKVVRAVCPHDCPDTCGLIVTVQDGKAIKLRGDKDHPFTDGYLCAKVNNYLDRVYHQDRLMFPMRRVGKKGQGKFERISWEEAIATITARFKEVAAGPHGPQAILPYSYAGTMGKLHYASLDRRFFHRLGASLLDRTICATAGSIGSDITLGTRAVIDPECTVHARYIINWGSNTSVTNIHQWTLMHQARKAGAKIVTIDPHRSKTAEKSDWWIPVRPGTDGALALGVMNVLFREGLEDADYLERYCIGTAELRERVRTEYSPETVARITGVPVADIEKLAREYAGSMTERGGPALIRLNYGMQRHGGGGMAVRTVVCLPAIIGAWRHPGGGAMLSTSKLAPWNGNALERPDLIPHGTRTINMVNLAEALHGELPGPPVMALYVYNSNPAAVNPAQSKVISGLEREDLFTVVHEQFPTDTVDFADIVLPATTQLEHFDLHSAYGHFYVQANEQAIAPLGEAKPNTEVFRLLAEAMGFERDIFQVTDEQLAREALTPVGSPNGYPAVSAFEGITLETLIANGPMRINVPENWAPFAKGNFGTPSGKCEFYSQREAMAGRDPLPKYVPPHEDPQTRPDLAVRHPLQMLCPPEATFLNSTFVNVDALRNSAKEPTLQINPVDANARKIAQGQRVEVFNDRGRFEAKAVIGETVKPGVVVTFGVWWSKITGGSNCNATTSTAGTDMGGGGTFFDNLVQVRGV